MAAFRLALLTVFLPLIVIAMLWRRARRPIAGWVTTFIAAAGVVGFSVFVAPWGWFGLPARYLLVLLFVVATVLSLRRTPAEETGRESPLRAIVKVLMGVLFGVVAIGVLKGYEVPRGAVDLGFPLRGGAYIVVHGGSTSPGNMHNVHPAQKYALDIVKLNAAGMRARGLYPRALDRYAIFGAEVVSPCDGIVRKTVDGLPDQAPGTADAKNPPGNNVIVRCGHVDAVLAHLSRGSVAVRPGATIRKGQLLGLVGNSGNTTEPHLHVHAERNGAAVPATFDGRWHVRNAVVRR